MRPFDKPYMNSNRVQHHDQCSRMLSLWGLSTYRQIRTNRVCLTRTERVTVDLYKNEFCMIDLLTSIAIEQDNHFFWYASEKLLLGLDITQMRVHVNIVCTSKHINRCFNLQVHPSPRYQTRDGIFHLPYHL